MFIGRKRELAVLNSGYARNTYGCIVLYGRRRVGKTALINEFRKDKPSIVFSALKGGERDNLRELSRVISEYQYGLGSVEPATFPDFRSALVAVSRLAENTRMVFCIDELPYLAASIPSSLSVLQHFLDNEAKEKKLFIILSGSSMSFMEEGVLSEKSPLYGRRTGQIRLQPFDYLECAQWFPSFSTEDKAFLYGITGGVPYYMECFTKAGSIREAVIESVLSPNGLLYEEPSFLLREELRDSFIYDSLIRAIAEGRTRMSEISSALGIETGMCSTYMKSLIELGFVRKETPVGKNGGRRTLYRIDDFFLLFWFRFVYRFSSSIASGRGEDVYDRIICSEINEYMGLVFERMVRDFILKYAATPFLIGQIGRWWGGNPRTHKEAEIDVVAVSAQDKQEGIIASCKYRNRQTDVNELALMKEYGDAMNLLEKRHYWFFSRGRFSPAMSAQAGENVKLFSLEDLYKADQGISSH